MSLNRAAIAILLLAGAGAAFAMSRRKAAPAGEGGGDPRPFDLGASDFINSIEAWTAQNYFETEANTMPLPMPATAQKLSAAGRAKLEDFEGFSATPYPDHKGQSIGFGHLIKPGENLTLLTRQEAGELLSKDVAWAENAVRSNIKVALSQGQFDALVSFCFNIGESAFARSTLVKRINAGDGGAGAEFDRWVFASGQRNSALVSRRRDERSAFESAFA